MENNNTRRRRKCSDFSNPLPTCYNNNQLVRLAKKWNLENPENKIDITLKKNELWNQLRKRHNNLNEDEWISSNRKSRRKIKYKFT